MTDEQGRFDGMDVPRDPEARWASLAHEAISSFPRGYRFTSEDLTRGIGLPDEPGSPANAAVGAAMARAKADGLIVRDGDRPAKRANQHGARIGLWLRT